MSRRVDEHFLIVRLAAVGDVVMASALARRIRDERPNARITWLTGATTAPLVRQLADVDEVIAIDERRLLRGGPVARGAVLLPLWRELRKRSFTRVMLLHVDARYRVVIAPLALVPMTMLSRATFGAMNPVPGRYFGDEYARLLDGLAHSGPITSHAPLGRVRELPNPSELEGESRPIVALIPGGARNVLRESGVRRWPVAHYASVARALAEQGARVVLLGDANDAWVRQSFENRCR